MKNWDLYGRDWIVTVAAVVALAVLLAAFFCEWYVEPQRLHTESWPEARQFAHECEDTGGTVTMRPHWHSQADRPYAATITCSR